MTSVELARASRNGVSADQAFTAGAAGSRPLRAELVQSAHELERHREGWDDLAVRCGRPYCAPGWMLAWWRHMAPAEAELRTVVVRADEQVVGLAPYFVQRAPAGFTEYRLLASGRALGPSPLALPGLEAPVAELVASALSESHPPPRAVRFEGTDAGSAWPGLIAAAWPARLPPLVHRDLLRPTPTVSVQGRSYEGWLAARSASFRHQMRRRRRRLVEGGAVFRLTRSADELERDLASLIRLHHARWTHRGGSGTLGRRTEEMLYDAGRQLLGDGRFRLWSLDVGGKTIAAQLLLAAGGSASFFISGFDDRWSSLAPSVQTMVTALEDCFSQRYARLDLGLGAEPYKLVLADGVDQLAWVALFPRDLHYPLTRVQALPAHVRFRTRMLANHLPPRTKARLLRALPGCFRDR